MAAPSSYHTNKLKIAAILLSFVVFLPSKPVGLGFPSYKPGSRSMSMYDERENLQVGSRPPVCVNKCFSCRPCIATLVIQPPVQKRYTTSRHDEGDIYYLMLWKCKCGNKLYTP